MYPEIKIAELPEETTTDGVKLYGKASYETQVALLSQYLHNFDSKYDKGTVRKRTDILNAIRDFLDWKQTQGDHDPRWQNIDDEQLILAAEDPFDNYLFSDFFRVPFPTPQEPKFRFIDLFAGIGGIRIPFDELGGKCVFSSEWDAAAQKTYFANFGELPFGDITKIKADFIPKHDILLAGFPCQAFSIMGKMKGFADTRGTLFFDVARILDYHHPKAILLENVKQLVTHDKGNTFKVILETLASLGYYVKWKVLNALDFGVPQKRERVIIVGFTEKAKADAFNFEFYKVPFNLADVLEPDDSVDATLFASDAILEKRRLRTEGKKVFYPSVWHENKSGNISVLPYACALRTGASYNYQLINGYRRPSSRELLRLQGFPDKFVIAVTHADIRRQTGNSVAVPMIRMVANKIINLIYNGKESPQAKRLQETCYA